MLCCDPLQHEACHAYLPTSAHPDAVHAYCSMWVLQAQPLGSTDERSSAVQTLRHYLAAGSHIVGRNQAPGQSSIVVEEDKSISRQHAVVTIAYAPVPVFRVKDMSRYGTLVNKQDLKGGEEELKEGDHLQFGHKSSFRLCRWQCSITALQNTPAILQHMSQLGFTAKDAESASCILTADRVLLTADLACTFAHHKPYVTEAWLQAVLQRPSLSSPPPEMVSYSPAVTTGISAEEMPLRPVYNQHLLAGFSFTLPASVSQAGAHFEEAVKLHGGSISSQAAASSTGTTSALVTTDLQKPDLSRVPPDINELHLTTVDHVLTAMLHSSTVGMTKQVSQEQLSIARGKAAAYSGFSTKRKASPDADLQPPSSKRRHTQSDSLEHSAPIQRAPAAASQAPASLPHVQSQQLQPPSEHIAEAADAPSEAAQHLEAVLEVSHQATVHQTTAAPVNSTIVWEPLIVRVQQPLAPDMLTDSSAATMNFKRFRKVQPVMMEGAYVPYATRGYAENTIDSAAFIDQQKSKHRQQQVAEELFNAKVRVQKQPALPLNSTTATKPGRGRGRGKSLS